MGKTVYLHIGSGKTGTSAIQVALVQRRDLLASVGLNYPSAQSDARARQGLVTSGNGHLLNDFLWPVKPGLGPRQKTVQEFQELLQSPPSSAIVYSSERLEDCNPESFSAFCKFLGAHGVRVRVIYYVRHLLDFALSSHSQAVKRGGFDRSFASFVKKYRCRYAETLNKFSGLVGKENMLVRLYENEEAHLVRGFVATLFDCECIADTRVLAAFDEPPTINRSLTTHELEAMLFVNKLIRDKNDWSATRAVSKKISDHLLSRAHNAYNNDITATRDEFRMLKELNPGVVDFVNEFVGGKFQLKYKSRKISIGPRTAEKASRKSAAYRAMIAHLVDQMEGAPNKGGAITDLQAISDSLGNDIAEVDELASAYKAVASVLAAHIVGTSSPSAGKKF